MSEPNTRPVPKDADSVEEQYDREYRKAIVKEAITEWLDAKFAEVGKWSLGGILAAGLALLAWWILISHGWKAPT